MSINKQMTIESYNELVSAISSNTVTEAQAAELVHANAVKQIRFTDYVKPYPDKDGADYKAAKLHWNQCKALVRLIAGASMQDGGNARLKRRMNGSHGVTISAKATPGSVADMVCEAERIQTLEAAHNYFKSDDMQSWESGVALKDLAAVAKSERRVPYKAYEKRDDGSHVLTIKAAMAWVESEDKRRLKAATPAATPAPVETPANVTPITSAPRKTAARKQTARKAARKPTARKSKRTS